MRTRLLTNFLVILGLVSLLGGCRYLPHPRVRERFHNPFPQLKLVAVVPFYNQSDSPTLDADAVTNAYYEAIQSVPGFEVLPVTATQQAINSYALMHGMPRDGQDFQALAKHLDVEAIVVGSVTDFDPFYPPRMAITTHWYAANEGFHPIPPGYGMPWGTKAEERIETWIVDETEFELARKQLATQTPIEPMAPNSQTSFDGNLGTYLESGPNAMTASTNDEFDMVGSGLPEDWPNPTDLIPDPPQPLPPQLTVSHDPVLVHTRLYKGDDPYFTSKLADYVETGDDARGSGWQGYLKRSDDFIRFCCHLHFTEMLAARGGKRESEFIVRFPLSRY
ncbi:MAG: hypothetical protein AAF664_00555 [Planctomycetota bacterium]